MTTAAAPATTEAAPWRTRDRVRAPHWAVFGLFAFYPLFWVTGFALFSFAVMSVPLLVHLVARRRLVVPPGFGLWLVFLLWVLLSASQLQKMSHYVAFASRYALWIGALVLLVYVLNTSRERLPDSTVQNGMVVLWCASVIGGYLGLFLGDTRLWTPADVLLPKSLTDVDLIANTTTPSFAQVQDFLGFPLNRPSAPYTFTNGWGAAMAVLTPVVIAAWPTLRPRARSVVTVLALASVVPIVVSVNRGLWVTLIVTFAYVGFRLSRRRDPRTARRLVVGGTLLAATVLLTPLGSLISERLDSEHSNSARFTLYAQVREEVSESPVLGYGSPRTNVDNPNYPPVGTHGMLWFVLFAHGVPGLLFFLAGLGSLVWRTSRAPNRRLLWLHGAVVASAVMVPFYDMFGVPLFALAACSALVLRDRRETLQATGAT
jgi:hypothetical protein